MDAKFTYVTGNANKLSRMRKMTSLPFDSADIDTEEIQSLSAREIAEHKARQAYEEIGSPILVEDTSLHIDSMGGMPGPFIKWFNQTIGPEGLCRVTTGERRARSINTFIYFDGSKMRCFEGVVEGSMAETPRGEGGFGFDSAFIPDGQILTKAEMSDEEIKLYSGRRIGLEKLEAYFNETK